jgi:hypothetical protein
MTRCSDPLGPRIRRIATAPASVTGFSNYSTFDIEAFLPWFSGSCRAEGRLCQKNLRPNSGAADVLRNWRRPAILTAEGRYMACEP